MVKSMTLHKMLQSYHALCNSLKNQSESLCLRILAFIPFQSQSDQIVLHSITSPTFSSTWEGFAMHANYVAHLFPLMGGKTSFSPSTCLLFGISLANIVPSDHIIYSCRHVQYLNICDNKQHEFQFTWLRKTCVGQGKKHVSFFFSFIR